MRYNYDSYKSLMVVDKRLTKKRFLQKAGVKHGKYAEDMFSRMYDWIFLEAICVEDIFEKYYKPEYSDFRDFLYKKYTMPYEIIDAMLAIKSENENCMIIDFDELSNGNGGFIHLVFDKNMAESHNLFDRVSNLLLMGEI